MAARHSSTLPCLSASSRMLALCCGSLPQRRSRTDTQVERAARQLRSKENHYTRPIALVRVQRTGRDQQGLGNIYCEDVRAYLRRNLSVPEARIRVQSSENKELAREDLLSEHSPVRWILTKDAFKEGWDCSFAYVLALLDNTTATTTITQRKRESWRVVRQTDTTPPV